MNDNIEIVYGKEDFFKLFELLVDDKMEEILQKVKQDNKTWYNHMKYYPSTNTNSEVDEKDE
ncbi:hypothetical protein [Clostridium beijerinckii]|uniref:Uncharacterized protein n=1 Tax=Clostridium beijerinckii TaxID=1520 RepID=A0AAE5H4N6_CLOBE|nr:hypothetical protein [Clostridium beijerinckii]ALB45666.1 hypothetical protein X276_10510 [Clostridium beijerinckii NRRL B-598]NRT86818.1 hypothetical protein [Clostridium beijerinckii]NSB14179.1 hypothetical protein [Clostridium beijerinckii]NYC72249.1 hypothetical protein [Clostridium beijerinckii]OOM20016.1 hypothetical protein CLOBE_51050 [Clostridium beijerinckii]